MPLSATGQLIPALCASNAASAAVPAYLPSTMCRTPDRDARDFAFGTLVSRIR
jgi:hypothetical protein